jgi:cytidine deaminase
MNDQRIAELIARAEAAIQPRDVGGRLFGDVGCALRAESGNTYVGVCIDTASGTGFCAEHSAIAAMVTAGELRIDSIVAVWKDEHGATYVLPPCGRCREFIRQVSEQNLDTDVVLDIDEVVKLRELLPYNGWSPQLVTAGS